MDGVCILKVCIDFITAFYFEFYVLVAFILLQLFFVIPASQHSLTKGLCK